MAEREPVVLLRFTDGKQLDENTFADYANLLVSKKTDGSSRVLAFPRLTTTKLRSIYSLIMNLYTKIGSEDDFEGSKSDIQYLKVKMAYEAGRERAVREFLDKTRLMAMIDRIKTFEQWKLYCRYAESLVAYFKFYGGE